MGYNYEALNPESFQKFAQALILAQHPDTQCLPVGQPDGGRDAFNFFLDPAKDGFVVFQVKFSRDPSTKDQRDVVGTLIASEKEKVEELIERGAKRYYLVTNVKGTAHLESGSIDTAHRALTDAFRIPSQVWWRDDLDARVDNSFDVKWSFPEICRATDVLAFLLKMRQGDQELESARAITSYFAKQYGVDRDVKFKQVDLKRRLTDLFVDLPLGRRNPVDRKARQRSISRPSQERDEIFRYVDLLNFDEDHHDPDGDAQFRQGRLAATFLLQMPLNQRVTRFVVEGAPGQGKSTVTQYLCQVNRIRLLKKTELSQLPDEHRNAPIRAPFRVDLRDYAAWISGRHPFAKTGEEPVPPEGRRSLESFLAMQIAWHSGGLGITQNDLLKFFAQSHGVIVLDGFDEVADIDTRVRVVAEICEASERLEVHARSLQIIVTSRPAAFANSPGFPEDEWIHLELKDLRRSDIESYKNKWMIAQGLTEDECNTVSNTLDSKLEQPHLRDLSRNPMQLAILLQLIHIQGAALPDKRTALYERYMELFFNREAEKSSIVRDQRDLLMALHGYLAWILQTQAEDGRGSGSITKKDLGRLVKNYLNTEEYGPDLADLLLRGMVERVVALVSRVEGTYEFEVQPLREYFAAKFLYETSPYSPAASEKRGTRPDRFEALAKSLYWTNVTRFFCGFYDKGELPALIDGITKLSEQDNYKFINQPRRLAMMLLSDWVFAQSPRAVKQLIGFITEEPGFHRLMTGEDLPRRRSLGLPDRSGQKELLESCLEKLEKEKEPHRRRALREVIAQNVSPDTLKALWLAKQEKNRCGNGVLLELTELGLINRLSTEEIKTISTDNIELQARLLARTGRYHEISCDEKLFEAARNALFAARQSFPGRRSHGAEAASCLEILSELLQPPRLVEMMNTSADVPAGYLMLHRTFPFGIEDVLEITGNPGNFGIVTKTIEFTNFVSKLMQLDATKWRKTLAPWSALVDRGFEEKSMGRLFVKIALISSAVTAKGEKGAWGNEGWRATQGLANRLRFARLKSGQADWWRDQLSRTTEADERIVCLTSCLLWMTPATLRSLRGTLIAAVEELPETAWAQLWADYRLIMQAAGSSRTLLQPSIFDGNDPSHSPRFATLALSRMDDRNVVRSVARLAFKDYRGGDPRIIRQAGDFEFYGDSGGIDWDYARKLSETARAAGAEIFLSMRYIDRVDVPEAVALDVLTHSERHAAHLIAACERAYGTAVARSAPKVSDTALQESWFEQDCE